MTLRKVLEAGFRLRTGSSLELGSWQLWRWHVGGFVSGCFTG